MKNKISIIILTLIFASFFAITVGAQSQWEAISGFNITNVTLDTYNETIDGLNNVAEFGEFDGNKLTNTELGEKMENIDRVPLIYVGAKRKINDKWSMNIRYEYIFGEVEQDFTTTDITVPILDENETPITTINYPGGNNEGSIAVDLHGITVLMDYEINENWYASGGVGYHQGTKSTDLTGSAYQVIEDNPDKDLEVGDNEYDLDNGISWRAGVGYDREFAEDWTFNGKVDYLYIELDDEQQGNIYSNGFSYTAGLTYRF